MITRFSVTDLSNSSIHLSKVASNKIEPDLILTNARILSTYTERIIDGREVWISNGRIACIKKNGQGADIFNKDDFVDEKKIASIGLRISKGRTYHGISLNVKMDLEPFKRINPCGYEGLEVAQISDFDSNVSMKGVESVAKEEMQKIFV